MLFAKADALLWMRYFESIVIMLFVEQCLTSTLSGLI